MSQRNVELLIGRLVTDEELRHRFARAPLETLEAMAERGCELRTDGAAGTRIDADHVEQRAARSFHHNLSSVNWYASSYKMELSDSPLFLQCPATMPGKRP